MSAPQQQLIDRTRSRISELAPQNAPLLLAVSGGLDSMVLLKLAVAASTAEPRELAVAHMDHGLRGAAGQADAQLVQSTAAQLGLRFFLETLAPDALRTDHAGSPEEAARTCRYRFLERIAQEQGFPFVAVAHHADDQAETVLINLLRGSGTSGLAGMRRNRRPLLRLRRQETRALCDELDLAPLRDPMNDDDRFQRVRVRHELIGLLGDIAKRDVVEVLVRQADVMRDDDDLLEELAAMIDVEDAKALATAPVALARRAVRQWLANPLPPDAATVERVLAVAHGDATACEIGNGREVRRSHQRLGIRKNDVR